MHSLRIQLVDAERSNKPVPGDPTIAVEIDTDALAELFKQRDEHDPGCYSINQAISTAIEALEHRNIAQNHRRHWFRLGNRRCVISPRSYFMINEISAVAVDNPANVYVRRRHRKTLDETISYFAGAVEGEVHPVNVAQLIILAQGQEMAMKQGSISNAYPLTVRNHPQSFECKLTIVGRNTLGLRRRAYHYGILCYCAEGVPRRSQAPRRAVACSAASLLPHLPNHRGQLRQRWSRQLVCRCDPVRGCDALRGTGYRGNRSYNRFADLASVEVQPVQWIDHVYLQERRGR